MARCRTRRGAEYSECILAQATRTAKDIEDNWDYLGVNKSQIATFFAVPSPALTKIGGISAYHGSRLDSR